MAPPAELSIEIVPKSRFEIVDVWSAANSSAFERYRRMVYCSHHTTAGYLEQSLQTRLAHSRERIDRFLHPFRKIFPTGADYRHDQLELRTELSPEQREVEPKNADSHLTFIGSGLRNCVTYRNQPGSPVYLVELDGVHEGIHRRRKTTLVGYDREERVQEVEIDVPISTRSIDVVNLRDPRLGVFEQLEEAIRKSGIAQGRVDISLRSDERGAGMTVNEYETLLMRHDLSEVLENPLRFVAEKGKHILRDPLSVPGKTRNYATYDLPFLFREIMDLLGNGDTNIERLAGRLTGTAARFLRCRRSISLLVSGDESADRIVLGRYQSPILLQWGASGGNRKLVAELHSFESAS